MKLTADEKKVVRALRIADRLGSEFLDLARIAGLNPKKDYRYADWRGVNFGTADLAGYDFSGADLRGSDFSQTWGIGSANFDGAQISGAKWPSDARSSSSETNTVDRTEDSFELNELELNVDIGEFLNSLVDEAESQETVLADREELNGRQALLTLALKLLDPRERHILIERRLKENPTTVSDLAQQYNISPNQVRRIEIRAFENLQKYMKDQIAERRLHRSGSG